MSTVIRDSFNALQIELGPLEIKALDRWYNVYVAKYALALNTALLGIDKPHFVNEQEDIFEIVGIERSTMKRVIRNIPNDIINSAYNVTPDPFNQMCVYVCHLLEKKIKTEKQKSTREFILNVQKKVLAMYHFKVFSSTVNRAFPHKPDEGLMTHVVEKCLTERFHIKKYKTWKNVILNQVDSVLGEKSKHRKTFEVYIPDEGVNYIITDCSTMIKDKLQGVIRAFYELKEEDDASKSIGTYSSIDEIDGEKVLRGGDDKLLTIADNISKDVLNPKTFIDFKKIQLVTEFVNDTSRNFTYNTLIQIFERISDLAVIQSKRGDLEKVKDLKEGGKEYIGIKILFRKMIQKTYRYLVKRGVSLKKKKEIIEKTKNIYTSSRMNDPDLLDIKYSLTKFIEETKITSRGPTISALRTAIVLYIMIKTFDEV